jgi:hypothetical protein
MHLSSFCSRHYGNYSLSRNFQLNENALAMRLILPLDVAYALLYTAFNVLVVVIRAQRYGLTNAQYSFYYNALNTVSPV